MYHHLLRQEGREAVTVFHEGEVYVADDNHPNWNAIKSALVADEEPDPDHVIDLFDTEKVLNREFKRLSERVLVSNGTIFVDGEEVDNSLTRQVLKFLEQGLDFKPLLNFFEKVLTNPNEHSREHLYRWLKARDFTLTVDGDFIAYKGVKIEDGKYLSVSKGTNTVIVDGKEVTGHVPNEVGSVVEMARSEVTFDPARGCDQGLHAGTWDYASAFAQGAVLEVVINPRDVVSVPTDSGDQKLRVCRYKVLKVTESERTSALADDLDDDSSDDVEYDSTCDNCGERFHHDDESAVCEGDGCHCSQDCSDEYNEVYDDEASDDESEDPIDKFRF